MHTNRPLFTWIEYYNATSSTLPPQTTGLVSLNGHTLRKKIRHLITLYKKKTQPHPTTREGIFYCSFFFLLLLIARTFFSPTTLTASSSYSASSRPGDDKDGVQEWFPAGRSRRRKGLRANTTPHSSTQSRDQVGTERRSEKVMLTNPSQDDHGRISLSRANDRARIARKQRRGPARWTHR